MSSHIKLSEIIENINPSIYWTTPYLDKETGEIISISDREFFEAENKFMFLMRPDGKPDPIMIAKEIKDGSERYVKIPSEIDLNELSIMQRFCLSIDDEFISEKLSEILKGKFVLDHFSRAINRFGIIEDWHAYFHQELKFFVKEWCDINEIDYIDDL